MTFPLYLALRNLLRHPGRNFLYVLGVSITAALLLDMILLSGGIRTSLQRVLKQMSYEIRLSPRGTLPFETDAQIYHFQTLEAEIGKLPPVEYVDGLLGANVRADFQGSQFPSFALGVQIRNSSLLQVESGALERSSNSVLVNQYLARDKNIRVGDRLKLWLPQEFQVSGTFEPVTAEVKGILSFALDAEGQHTIFCSLPFLQQLIGQKEKQPASVIMLKLRDSSHATQLAEELDRRYPQVSAYTIHTVIEAVDKQLSYFKQFAFILGGISLVVTFVLVFIITTISFHDRLGEIALLRAIGLSNRTLFTTILFEGILTAVASAIFGFILGKFVAAWLDSILKSAPGLPETFSFFVMEPASFVRAAIVLLLTGFFAGLYPAAAAARLPVSDTLREEIL